MGGPRGSNIDWRGQNWKKFGWNVLWLKWFQRNIEETDRDGSFRADSTEKLESGRKLKNPKEKKRMMIEINRKEIYWHGSTVSGSFSTKVVLLTSKVISNLTDAADAGGNFTVSKTSAQLRPRPECDKTRHWCFILRQIGGFWCSWWRWGEFYGRVSWVDRVSAPSTEKCLLLIR